MIKNKQSFLTGLIFLVFGFFFFSASILNYDLGSIESMGPGFFPITVSSILIFIGTIQLGRGLFDCDEVTSEPFYFGKAIIITSAIFLHAILLVNFGAIIAMLLLMFSTAILHPKFNWLSFLISYLALLAILFAYRYFLGSNIPLWNF